MFIVKLATESQCAFKENHNYTVLNVTRNIFQKMINKKMKLNKILMTLLRNITRKKIKPLKVKMYLKKLDRS